MDMRAKITKAVDNSHLESLKFFHGEESKNCFGINQNNTMEGIAFRYGVFVKIQIIGLNTAVK
uniref:Uncharacterized protein n=1 Tax=Meloidogyne enterolobii TaxID=390850 RepID=A0A6V7TWA4_MELEN|nr:unnamed protein product [Meloidogyne enterolobii]